FFQAEDGIRDDLVTGVQTCALPILISGNINAGVEISHGTGTINNQVVGNFFGTDPTGNSATSQTITDDVGVRLEGSPTCSTTRQIGRASCRERVEKAEGGVVVG